MKKWSKITALSLAFLMPMGLAACGSGASGSSKTGSGQNVTTDEEREEIESALNLANLEDFTWTYDSDTDSWTSAIATTVVNPELSDYQGVSINVPDAYVEGIDTDGDGKADVTSDDASGETEGTLIVDHDGTVKNENGQTYTADSAPVIINTGAAGYSAQENQSAAGTYASYGYINVACGNRGKQSTATDSDGNTYYTGDAPLCLVDQKNAIRFVKYNILLGNLPGSTEYFVSTGGSGGGAHAVMVAATGNNSDYFDYEAESGAAGVYENEDGTFTTAVTIDGEEQEITDSVWGCVAYSPITSLAEADMAQAFEYHLDTDYDYNTDFQAQLAEYLSDEYMDYINDQNLTVKESDVDLDINEDGDTEDTVDLTIEYDEDKYGDTNGYGGTYLTFYQKEFEQNLNWYLDNLDYASDWTWFDEEGNALSDSEVASMSTEDKAEAFLEGRYAKGSSTDSKGFDGNGTQGGMMGAGGGKGQLPDGAAQGEKPDGDLPDGADGTGKTGTKPDLGTKGDADSATDNSTDAAGGDAVGTPDAGTTQSADSSTDSSTYDSYSDMLEAYETDISSIEEGDKYGNNIVDLYNPLNYIGEDDTDAPTWTRIMMGGQEGDMSLFCSLNLQIAWLNSGTDAELEWQWDGGHVPSEIFGESLALYVDEMYGEYVDGAAEVTKASAEKQTENGDADEATGTDISSWVSYADGEASFSLESAAAYRAEGANKAVPGFDVIDYGQETYEFGNSEQDARHFDQYVLQALQDHEDELSKLFNQ